MRDQKDDGYLSAMPVVSEEMGRAFQNGLGLVRVLKELKYFWNLPKNHLAILLEQLSRRISGDEESAHFGAFQRLLLRVHEGHCSTKPSHELDILQHQYQEHLRSFQCDYPNVFCGVSVEVGP